MLRLTQLTIPSYPVDIHHVPSPPSTVWVTSAPQTLQGLLSCPIMILIRFVNPWGGSIVQEGDCIANCIGEGCVIRLKVDLTVWGGWG